MSTRRAVRVPKVSAQSPAGMGSMPNQSSPASTAANRASPAQTPPRQTATDR